MTRDYIGELNACLSYTDEELQGIADGVPDETNPLMTVELARAILYVRGYQVRDYDIAYARAQAMNYLTAIAVAKKLSQLVRSEHNEHYRHNAGDNEPEL